jgi:hypothetical protein
MKTRLLTLTALAAAPLALALTPSVASAMAPEGLARTTQESVSPQLRVSDVGSFGSEHRTQVLQAWTDCLIEAGAPTLDPNAEARPVPAENISPTYGLTLAWPPPASARAACADKAPIYPPALEAATNPDFAALAQTYVSCLQGHGEYVRLLNDRNLDWTYRAGHDVPEDNARIEDDCLVGTFGSD